MAIRPKKPAKNQPKSVVDPEPDIAFEDETGAELDPDPDDGDEPSDEDVELEVEPAKIAKLKKGGLFIALKVVRVNPRGKLPDGSVHVGDVYPVGSPPFAIEDPEQARDLLRKEAIRPATERDLKRARSRAA